MSRQQLESIFATPPAPKPTPKPASRPEKRTFMLAPRPASRPKNCTLKDSLKPKKRKLALTPRPEKPLPLNTPKECKPKKIAGTLDDKYIEYKSEGNQQLTIKEHLENIRPYLNDMINDFKKSGKW